MSRIPWWAKISAKLVLARLPLPAAFWRQVRLFRHGAMDDPAYALRIFRHHFARAGALPPGWTCLELGPGDSVLTALIAKAYGASRVYLVDAGNFAATDARAFLQLAEQLKAEGLPVPDLHEGMSVAQILDLCQATYLTAGLASLRNIPAQSIDFAFSNAVLEHVRAAEFAPTMLELRRVMHPDGCQSHSIDLKDHLQASLNNLRFSPEVWEGSLFSNSGFYTNRLRHAQIISLIGQAGFSITEVANKRWPALPLPKNRLHPSFHQLDEQDLCISEFEVVLKAV